MGTGAIIVTCGVGPAGRVGMGVDEGVGEGVGDVAAIGVSVDETGVADGGWTREAQAGGESTFTGRE